MVGGQIAGDARIQVNVALGDRFGEKFLVADLKILDPLHMHVGFHPPLPPGSCPRLWKRRRPVKENDPQWLPVSVGTCSPGYLFWARPDWQSTEKLSSEAGPSS